MNNPCANVRWPLAEPQRCGTCGERFDLTDCWGGSRKLKAVLSLLSLLDRFVMLCEHPLFGSGFTTRQLFLIGGLPNLAGSTGKLVRTFQGVELNWRFSSLSYTPIC